jgi:hypothetical protein
MWEIAMLITGIILLYVIVAALAHARRPGNRWEGW